VIVRLKAGSLVHGGETLELTKTPPVERFVPQPLNVP
jgi:hypothetical protein